MYYTGIVTNPIRLVNKLQNTLSVNPTRRARDIYRGWGGVREGWGGVIEELRDTCFC